MDKSIKKLAVDLSGFRVRPNADNGLWLAVLLPLSVIVSALKHPAESSNVFKLCTVLAFGLLLTAFIFIVQHTKSKRIHNATTPYVAPGIVVAVFYYVYFQRSFPFSCFSGLAAGLLFYKLYVYILKHFSRCFSLGEAFVVTQALVLYLFATTVSVFEALNKAPKTPFQISTLIIQIGLFAVGLLCCVPYKFQCFRKTAPFYILVVIVTVFILLIPLHVLLRRSPLLFVGNMLFSDMRTLRIVIYWASCCVIAVLSVSKQIRAARKASTVIRKTFHILAVAVFLPGLLYQCCLLYLASGVIFGIFVVLELLRVLNLPPLGIFLQDGFFVFSDDKDAGAVALTPLYLLVGCSMPLWLHPAPCDLTNSAEFNLLPLLSGLLSVGIGDTAASYVGSWVGKHKWPGTRKTIEGTLACILSQALFVYLLMQLGYIAQFQNAKVKVIAAIIVGSLVEAKTNQVDNLVLPLIMYTILI